MEMEMALWKCQCFTSLPWLKRELRITPGVIEKAFEYCSLSCRKGGTECIRPMKHTLVQVPLATSIPPTCSAYWDTEVERQTSWDPQTEFLAQFEPCYSNILPNHQRLCTKYRKAEHSTGCALCTKAEDVIGRTQNIGLAKRKLTLSCTIYLLTQLQMSRMIIMIYMIYFFLGWPQLYTSIQELVLSSMSGGTVVQCSFPSPLGMPSFP